MKEKIFDLAKLAVLLVLLGTPIAAWAKAATTEITISGGGSDARCSDKSSKNSCLPSANTKVK